MPPNDTNDRSGPAKLHPSSHATNSAVDEAAKREAQQKKLNIENQLRIKKNDLVQHQQTLRELERDIQRLQSDARQIEEEHRHTEEEVRRLAETIARETSISRQAEVGFVEKNQELNDTSKDIKTLEKEIDKLKIQIKSKEDRIHDLKSEKRDTMKEQEDLRRKNVLEHFSAKTESEHMHEKSVHLQLLALNKKRADDEVANKQKTHIELKRDLNLRLQEIQQLENQLVRMHTAH